MIVRAWNETEYTKENNLETNNTLTTLSIVTSFFSHSPFSNKGLVFSSLTALLFLAGLCHGAYIQPVFLMFTMVNWKLFCPSIIPGLHGIGVFATARIRVPAGPPVPSRACPVS